MNTNQAQNAHRWHILGAGAMGCLWAGRMALAGQDVQLLLHNRQALAAYKRLQIETSGQIETVQPIACLVTEIDAPIHNLLVCTKAGAIFDALEDISAQLDRPANIVLMQNGMGFHEQIASRFGEAALFCALSTEGAWTRERFHVVHAGRGSTQIGAWRTEQAELEPTIISAFRAGPLSISRCADLQGALWQKLSINCAINPLTALHGINNGDLLTHPSASIALREVIMEIEQVLTATGRSGLATDVDEMIRQVIVATANNQSSMRQDLEAGRMTEIEFMTGFLCQQAESAGIDVPVNRGLYERVKEMTL